MKPKAALALACLLVAGGAVAAPALYVTSIGPSSVQVVLNRNVVRTLGLGESSPEGVRLERIENGVAIFQVEGRPVALRLGQSTSTEMVLKAARDGYFRQVVYIAGAQVPAIIDTGATNVSMSYVMANRLRINYRSGQRGISHTANGSVASYYLVLPAVQVGDFTFRNVPTTVTEGFVAQQDEVLIGNSVLRYLRMERYGDTMVLRAGDGF